MLLIILETGLKVSRMPLTIDHIPCMWLLLQWDFVRLTRWRFSNQTKPPKQINVFLHQVSLRNCKTHTDAKISLGLFPLSRTKSWTTNAANIILLALSGRQEHESKELKKSKCIQIAQMSYPVRDDISSLCSSTYSFFQYDILKTCLNWNKFMDWSWLTAENSAWNLMELTNKYLVFIAFWFASKASITRQNVEIKPCLSYPMWKFR